MTDEPAAMQAEAQGEDSSYRRAPPRKEYVVSEPKTNAFMVEDAQWERLQGRVEKIEGEPSISWLTSAAWTAISVAISAVLAVIVFPNSKGTHLGSGVRPALWAIAGASFFLAVILIGVYFWAKKARKSTAGDICAEMDTIHDAWVERKEETPEPAAGG
jgi:hypothetical protein